MIEISKTDLKTVREKRVHKRCSIERKCDRTPFVYTQKGYVHKRCSTQKVFPEFTVLENLAMHGACVTFDGGRGQERSGKTRRSQERHLSATECNNCAQEGSINTGNAIIHTFQHACMPELGSAYKGSHL